MIRIIVARFLPFCRLDKDGKEETVHAVTDSLQGVLYVSREAYDAIAASAEPLVKKE